MAKSKAQKVAHQAAQVALRAEARALNPEGLDSEPEPPEDPELVRWKNLKKSRHMLADSSEQVELGEIEPSEEISIPIPKKRKAQTSQKEKACLGAIPGKDHRDISPARKKRELDLSCSEEEHLESQKNAGLHLRLDPLDGHPDGEAGETVGQCRARSEKNLCLNAADQAPCLMSDAESQRTATDKKICWN